jgi:hypothetical protein
MPIVVTQTPPTSIVITQVDAGNVTVEAQPQSTIVISSVGVQGLQGPAGSTGPAGADGPAGPTGADGPQGPQGPAGSTGAQGIKGDTGDTGPQGIQGIQGPAGPAGNDGATGAQGPAGANGQGVPAGGTTGQVLAKINATDFNTQWVTPSGGGGGSQEVYVQQARPSAAGPWQWWVTDATGRIINLIVNDGA